MNTKWIKLAVVTLILMGVSNGVGAKIARGDAERGKLLYEKYCSECHGKEGDGTGAVGDVIDEKPANFRSPQSKEKTDQELFDSIQFGRTVEMHPWEGFLSQQDIWDIVKYIRTLAPYAPQKEKTRQ